MSVEKRKINLHVSPFDNDVEVDRNRKIILRSSTLRDLQQLLVLNMIVQYIISNSEKQ